MSKAEQRQIQSEKDKWMTPEWLYQGIDERLDGGIDIDPCAGPDTEIGAVNWALERDEDGLERFWEGTVFVNPPFSQKKRWVDKVVTEYVEGNVECAFLVTPASPTVKSWFHGDRGDKHGIADAVDYIWLPSGRVKFIDPETGKKAGSPAGGTMISVFGTLPLGLYEWMVKGEEDTPNDGGLVVKGVSL